jgi:hypothetical protein
MEAIVPCAASLFEHKLKTGRIKSAKSREKWEYVIRLHLAPVFGELFIDAVRRTDIKKWKEAMGKMIQAGELHPGTANDRLAMLGRILGAAAEEFEWERNPMSGVDRFDTSEHPTYTEEEPNLLTVEGDAADLSGPGASSGDEGPRNPCHLGARDRANAAALQHGRSNRDARGDPQDNLVGRCPRGHGSGWYGSGTYRY